MHQKWLGSRKTTFILLVLTFTILMLLMSLRQKATLFTELQSFDYERYYNNAANSVMSVVEEYESSPLTQKIPSGTSPDVDRSRPQLQTLTASEKRTMNFSINIFEVFSYVPLLIASIILSDRIPQKHRRKLNLTLTVLALIISYFATYRFGVYVGSATLETSSETILEHGSLATEATYVVGRMNSTHTYAKRGFNGQIDFIGTDFSTILYLAVNATENGGGGLVFIRASGSTPYSVTSTVKLGSNIAIMGEGEGTNLKIADNAGIVVFRNKNPLDYIDRNIIIANLQIDGNKANQPLDEDTGGIYFIKVTDFRVEGLYIHHVASPYPGRASKYGMNFNTCLRGQIIRNRVSDSDFVGIYLCSGGQHVVAENVIKNQYGITLDGASLSVVANNFMVFKTATGTHGIKVMDVAPTGVVVVDNVVQYYDIGILLAASDMLHPPNNNLVAFNSLYGNTNGIFIGSGVQKTYVIANIIQGSTTPVTDSGIETKIKLNFGYVTENSGTATGTSPIAVAHGLATTPTIVLISPQGSTPYQTSNTANATHITIYHNAPTSITVSWYAEV